MNIKLFSLEIHNSLKKSQNWTLVTAGPMTQVVESIHPQLQAIKIHIGNSQVKANPFKKIHLERRPENPIAAEDVQNIYEQNN